MNITVERIARTAACLYCFLLSLAVVSVLLAMAVPALAQAGRGSIEGLVADQTGAVIPGASVQVVQIQTNATLDFLSNNEGLYTAPNLPMGTYRLVIKKEGFGTLVREPIDVRPSVKVRVDVVLMLGAIEKVVTVTSIAPMIDISATSNSAGIGEKLISDLPVIVSNYQRAITDMLNNLPGSTNSGSFITQINGGQKGDTEVYIDGGPSSEWGISRGGLSEVSPMIDQVGEFSMVSNGFNAEYGGSGNSFVNVTIKSGTNQFHGSFFDHIGDSALNAKNFFAKEVTPFNQHESGFTLGGPVVIPGVYDGRDKTFFFGSLGVFISRQGASGNLMTVPTALMQTGDFSELGTPIIDPETGIPFPGNVIPESRFSEVSKKILPYLPQPDEAGTTFNYHSKAAPQWPHLNSYSPLVKVDHSWSNSQKSSVMFQKGIKNRIIWNGGLTDLVPWGTTQTNPVDGFLDQIANNWKFRFNHDSIITPSLINHITFSLDSYVNRGANKTAGQGWDTVLGIQGIPADDGSFPEISFTGDAAAPATLGRSYDENWEEKRINLSENLTWIRGKHIFKLGFAIGQNNEDRIFGSSSGTFQFSNQTLGIGSSFAAFLLGEVYTTSARMPLKTQLRFRTYSAFIQDEWRIRNNITLSYGLRWDYMPPMRELADYMTSFQPDLLNPETGTYGALAYAGTGAGKYGRNFQDDWHKGFSPRLGISYQLNDKTVLRASGGIVYSNSGNMVPFLSTGADGYSALPTFYSTGGGFNPVFNWDTGAFPNDFNKPSITPNPSFLNGQPIDYIPRNGSRLPQIVNWNLVITRELIPNISLELSYQGNRSTHLPLGSGATQLNYLDRKYNYLGATLLLPYSEAIKDPAIAAIAPLPYSGFTGTLAQALKPYPQYSFIRGNSVLFPNGKGSFHSLQAKVTQRYSHGLSGLYYFTWMKGITNALGGTTTYTNFIEGALQYPGDLSTTIDPGTPKFVFGASYSYDLPVGKGRHFLNSATRAVDAVLGGWTLAGFLRYQSGSPLQIAAIFPQAGADLGYSQFLPAVYANYNGGDPYLIKDIADPATQRYLNAGSFSIPDAFTYGNTTRQLSWVTGPWQMSEGISLRKSFSTTKTTKFEIGLDMTNPFNIVRWGNPNTTLGVTINPVPGLFIPIPFADFGRVNSTQGERQMQINLKFSF
jgi:hypothetical protein